MFRVKRNKNKRFGAWAEQTLQIGRRVNFIYRGKSGSNLSLKEKVMSHQGLWAFYDATCR